ncbi:hypothetical protein M1437_02140 [Patescibacteria group bacterium]|nr:hypothetical protein [Patescibacteria group bacterium]
MKHSAPLRLRVERDVVTRVVRALDGKGELSVAVGQQVTPEEIMGTATVTAGFRAINLSTQLKVAPEDTEKYLTRKIGQRIYKGELLAYKKGGFLNSKKMVIAPTDGILDFLNPKTGELKIIFLPKKVQLPAGVYGIVEAVNNEKGQVIIRTQVSRIHGVFGSGGCRDGIVHVLSRKDDLVSKSVLQQSDTEHILVGGGLFYKDTISAAISLGVNGIITGGINAEDYNAMAGGRIVFPKKLDTDIGVSLVVCEGFGSIPIGDDIFSLLQEYQGRFVFIDGNKALISLPSAYSSSLVKIKSTQLPPLQINDLNQSVKFTQELMELKVGLKVRIIGNSYPAEQGKLLAVNDSLTVLPSGASDYLATIETARRKIQVPVANLEVMM